MFKIQADQALIGQEQYPEVQEQRVLQDQHEATPQLYLPLQVEAALYPHRQHREGAVRIQRHLLQAEAVPIRHLQTPAEVVQSRPDPLQAEVVEEAAEVVEEAAEVVEDNIRLVNFKT